MAREHLFRGKRLDNGEWVEGSLVRQTMLYGDPIKERDYILCGGEFDGDYYDEAQVDSDTVCEYTGLKDHNKEKIFEGDKVRIYPDDEIGTIEWSEETARFLIVLDDIVCDFDNFNGYELEIIGNCWDNPNLMEAEG